MKVHVVGFALGAGESNKLQCVVQQTGGKYFDADDATALRADPGGGRQMVTQAQPKLRRRNRGRCSESRPRRAPARWSSRTSSTARICRARLGSAEPQCRPLSSSRRASCCWSIRAAAGFGIKDAVNIVRIKDEMPDGDWDIVVRRQAQVPERHPTASRSA